MKDYTTGFPPEKRKILEEKRVSLRIEVMEARQWKVIDTFIGNGIDACNWMESWMREGKLPVGQLVKVEDVKFPGHTYTCKVPSPTDETEGVEALPL